MAQLHMVRIQFIEMDDLDRLKKLAGVVPASFSGMNPYNVDNNSLAIQSQNKTP